MPVTVVVGAQWGDEGKAKVIDLLAKEHATSCATRAGTTPGTRWSSAASATPCSSIPSGVLYDHVVPVIANGVVVDLPTLFDEIDTLEARGVSCDRLRCRATPT